MSGLFKRRKELRTLTEAERRILDLLLHGESPTFQRLRRQVGPPLLMWVERERRRTQYSVDLVFDAAVREEFTIGEWVSTSPNDLIIVDKRIPHPIRCEAAIGHGILGNVVCTAPHPVRWPEFLQVDEWFYEGADGQRSKTRTIDWDARFAEDARPKPLTAGVLEMLPDDYLEYSRRPHRSLQTPGARLKHLDEIYLLDHDRIDERMAVFGETSDGNVLTFQKVPGVYEIDRESLEVTRLAGSFQEWLERESRGSR